MMASSQKPAWMILVCADTARHGRRVNYAIGALNVNHLLVGVKPPEITLRQIGDGDKRISALFAKPSDEVGPQNSLSAATVILFDLKSIIDAIFSEVTEDSQSPTGFCS